MTITIIIPTYRRPRELARCLGALRNQSRQADEIIVVVRDTDTETKALLAGLDEASIEIRLVTVRAGGQVAALNAGLNAAKSDIIVFTDDDTIPHPDWFERIERDFMSDPGLGGLGGRDYLYRDGIFLGGYKAEVGKIRWFGQIIGNHHLGDGNPREVGHLKGVNMSYRSEAVAGLRFDERLRGQGAQYRNDMAFSLAVKRAGWKLIYDPAVAIDHFDAARYDEDNRTQFNPSAVENAAYNEMLIFLNYLPFAKRVICIIYSVLVGTLYTPGLAQWLRVLITKRKNTWVRVMASVQGGWKCFRDRSSQE